MAGPTSTSELGPATERGVVWKIDRFASHDGPGIRTLVYFKGCPLRCEWCSNPEGQAPDPVLVFQAAKCTGCGLCIEACPLRALQLVQDPEGNGAGVQIDRSRCQPCQACVASCPDDALQVWGRRRTTGDLLEVLDKDRAVHARSGGGLTCTGGDPVYQWRFLVNVLEACAQWGIHTAVETCAYADEAPFKSAVERLDWLFIDLKHMDTNAHLRWTGKSNGPVLRNARLASHLLKARGKALVIRQVVVPGVNDGQNISDLADFLCSLPLVTAVELLPYHIYGASKYGLLGRRYGLGDAKPPSDKAMEACKKVLRDRGLTVA
ncbi:MAG: glycyl-radical enzyme activating protein [Chloroflexi bacterium]|nr:glycyl-radical enzyme activating protein [Chloroflexota bacterium]